MMIKIVTGFLILFCLPFSGWCDYMDLKSTLENYTAPSRTQLFTPIPMEARNIPTQTEGGFFPLIQSNRSVRESSVFLELPPPLAHTLSGVERDEKKAAFLVKKQISPELLAGMVLLRNPGIARARDLVGAELSTYSQVVDLDLVLEQYAAFTKGLMNGVGPVRGRLPIEMAFPFPGVTALKGQVVDQSVAAAREALLMVERNAVTDIQRAFWDMVYLIRAQDITRETLGVFKKLQRVADSLYRSGKTGFQDVTRVTVKIYMLEDALVSLKEKRLNIQSVILSLLNLPSETILGPPVLRALSLTVPDIETLYTRAHQNRQELKQARAMIGKMEGMVELAETMILPGFDLGFSRYGDDAVMQVGSLSMTPSFAETISSSMGKGLPKRPWYGIGASWLMETRKRLAAAREGLRGMEADTRKMVRQKWYELDRAVRKANLYGESVVELSATALDVSTREYESGRIPFADVAGSYSDWLKARLEHAKALSDIGISRTQLVRIIGTGS